MQDQHYSSDDPFVLGIPTRKSGEPEAWDQDTTPKKTSSTGWAKMIAALSALSLFLLAALPL
jgi:hypothetical protein